MVTFGLSSSEDILKASQKIFNDVQDDFSDVKKILSRFNEWRVSFSESYTNAYISLCLPKLLAPLIRHQLIGWNPLKVSYSFLQQFLNTVSVIQRKLYATIALGSKRPGVSIHATTVLLCSKLSLVAISLLTNHDTHTVKERKN